MTDKMKLLFLCTGNSCRSQMAEAWVKELAGDRLEAYSAGTEPAAQVHPLAVQVMAESGVDIKHQQPKDVMAYLGKVHFQYVITVCDNAQAQCPAIWPGLPEGSRLFWPFFDPAQAEGSEEERLVVFRRVRDEIRHKLEAWLPSVYP